MSFKHNPKAAEILRRRRKRMLEQSGLEVYEMSRWAIRNRCEVSKLQELLGDSPSLRGSDGFPDRTEPLLEVAAEADHVPVLAYLLEQGLRPKEWSALLEAAVRNEALHAIELLRERGDAEYQITEGLLRLWAGLGMNRAKDVCLRAAAECLLDWKDDDETAEIPLLPGLNVLHAAQKRNVPLVVRLCRETPVTVWQVETVLNDWIHQWMGDGDLLTVNRALCDLTDALLVACPAAMESPKVRYLLSMALVCAEGGEAEELQGWMEWIPEGEIPLANPEEGQRFLFESPEAVAQALHRWKERLGHRFRPVLERDDPLSYELLEGSDHDTVLRAYFDLCTVKGTPPECWLSPLAEDVLQLASPALITELCEQKKLFWEENAAALLAFCDEIEDGDAKRIALLGGGIQKQVDYLL